MQVAGPTDNTNDIGFIQDRETIEIDPEETNETESTVDPTDATASCPNSEPIPPLVRVTQPALAMTNMPSAESRGATPVPETPSVSLSVSFDAAQDLLALGKAPENSSGLLTGPTINQSTTDGKPATANRGTGTTTSAPAPAGRSVKGKRSKDEHKKRTNLNSTTPEYVFFITYTLSSNLFQ